ncbi:hypothetical protein KEJ21_01605 [Candidatus Bathyarchaeota archaeon]|nr:hypothetical protein [Candidatus Bathyarchaeota archaeon]
MKNNSWSIPMSDDLVGSLFCRLYELCFLKSKEEAKDRIREGHKFEDEADEEIYSFAREVGFDPNPPRMTLELPTRSGNLHQFDASFRHKNSIFVVEYKNTQSAAKDYLYYFNAKIMDYLHALDEKQNLSIKGIFLSTFPVADSAWRYRLAYGIRIVEPGSSPPEYILRNFNDKSLVTGLNMLLERIEVLADRVSPYDDSSKVLEDYRFLCRRWRDV